MKGRIHSLESFGTVDGPGIRFVIFMQGCSLRCLYCHNPDTWDNEQSGKYQMTPEELIAEVKKYESFIKTGGVTVTGGEPLLQPEFIKEFFKLCREEGIHTALDTSGYASLKSAEEVLDYTDLVLLDIKSFQPETFKKVTGVPIEPTLQFLELTNKKNIPVWVRFVLVPGLTDDLKGIKQLGEYIRQFKNVEHVEVLPFHKMGEYKWETLGEKYLLKDTEPPSKELIEHVKELLQVKGER